MSSETGLPQRKTLSESPLTLSLYTLWKLRALEHQLTCRFLLIGMPEVMKHLSYRIVDVSSVKVSVAELQSETLGRPSFEKLFPANQVQEIARRWYPQLIKREKESRQKESAHR